MSNKGGVFALFLNREEDTENENEKKIWYYSTRVQLAELIDCLDKDYWEAELCKILEEMREEIHRHMDITEDLTNKARGSNKSFLAAANGEGNFFIILFVKFEINSVTTDFENILSGVYILLEFSTFHFPKRTLFTLT